MPRRLYFMVKPPPPIAAHMPGTRPVVDLLHITLLPLGDLLLAPPHFIDTLIAIGDGFRAPSFRVVFDRLIGSGRTLGLRGSEPMRGAVAFQAALVDAVKAAGVILPAYRFTPHITLDYEATIRGAEAIEPISWLVEEFLLIESVVGERRHIAHARWPLTARPG